MKSKAIILLTLFASPLGSAPAMADAETRSVITTRIMPASPETVLRAFLDDGDLEAWWKVSRSLVERKENGVWSITWDDYGEEKTQHAWSGVIEELTPNRLVVGHLVMNEPDMELFGPMRLDIDVEAVAGSTSLTVTHSGYRYGGDWDRIYELVVDGWAHVLVEMETWMRESN